MICLLLALLNCVSIAHAKVVWLRPGNANGNGSGDSKANAHGDSNAAQNLLQPGDTLRIVDGVYHSPFTVQKSGTANNYIRYEAESVGGVTFDMQQQRSSAVNVLGREWVIVDGLRAGDTTSWAYHMLNNNDIKITRCGCWNGGSTPEKCDNDHTTCDHNSHCFEFAFSSRVLGEDLWVWGAWRYGAVLYQTRDSTLRRVSCRGGPWSSLPHACLTSYCNQNSNIENAIVFGVRRSKDAPNGNPFQFVHGGFVSDAHGCGPYTPPHNNVMHGVISIDNGTPRSERPDSSPYQFLVMSHNGWDEFEDVVAWSESEQGDFFVTLTPDQTPPSYWKGPKRYIQRTGKYNVCDESKGSTDCPPKNQMINTGNVRLQNRWVDKVYTNEPLWPWPYEDIIERDFKLGMTLTEYVQSKLGSELVLQVASNPTPKPPSPTPKPSSPTPKPPTPNPPTPKPANPTPQPANPTPQPANPSPQPAPSNNINAPTTSLPVATSSRVFLSTAAGDTTAVVNTAVYKPVTCEEGTLLCYCTSTLECNAANLYCELNAQEAERGLCLKKAVDNQPPCVGELGCVCSQSKRCFDGAPLCNGVSAAHRHTIQSVGLRAHFRTRFVH